MENFNALLTLSEIKTLYSGNPAGICPLYKGSIGATKRCEATGNTVVIPKYVSLEKLAIDFSPKQAGNGDPSPENVRPISGWDNVQVKRCGKNLVDIPKIDQSTPNNKVFVVLPASITISANYSSVEIKNSIWRFSIVFLDGSMEYAVDDKLSGIYSTYQTFNGTQENPITEINYRNIYIERGEISDIMINIGSTPEPYTPYQGNDYTLTLPQTIYGGTVDAVTGMGSKTWGFIASYNGEAIPREWISDRDVYSAGTTPTTGAQVAYKLATPESFNVSQVSIPSLRGENYFFTNGKNMDIIYKVSSFWGDVG